MRRMMVSLLSLTLLIGGAQARENTSTFSTTITVKPKVSLATQCAQGVSEQSDLAASLALCNAALEENPEDARTYFYRGYNHFYLDEYARAEADFSEAIRLDVDQLAKAYYARGSAREAQRKLKEASEDFKMAHELAPDWSSARRKVESYAWAYEEE